MAELVTRLTVEIDTEELDYAVERYALVSRADVQRIISAAIIAYDKSLPRRLAAHGDRCG